MSKYDPTIQPYDEPFRHEEPACCIITDEMVEKAYEIWLRHADAKRSLRAALEAVAPMIITDYLARRTAKAITQELDPK